MVAKNEPLYNDEGLSKDILLNLSGATHEDILSKIDEIYESWDEVEEEADPEKFCEDCEHRYTVREREEYWGSICYREFETCRAEFDPEDPTCPRSREYEEALENRNRVRKALDTLYQAEEAFMNKKGA
ncbi:MAG TPA: hypothetical protein PL035_04745 [Bacillota bacterium]|nr:hypothetical protein [Bacillota bacterium]